MSAPLHASFPTANDLKAYLASLGVLNPGVQEEVFQQMDLPSMVAAAQAEWEEKSGWEPTPSDSVDVARYFDPPGAMDLHNGFGLWRGGGKILDLTGPDGAGLVTLTSLVTGYSLNFAGSPLTENRDFYLLPYNAALAGRPYETILFTFYQTGLPRSIVITGRWGFQLAIPDDIWKAVQFQAAHLCYPQLSLQISKGLVMLKEDQGEVRYAAGPSRPLAAEAIAWKEYFRQVVKRHKRIVV